MAFNPNQFQIQRQTGSLTSDPNFNVLTVKIDATQGATALTYGQAVKIVGASTGLLNVIGATSAADNIFGFVNYSIKKQNFYAGDYIAVAFSNSIMFMTASASIDAGAEVMYDPSTSKIATQTASNTVVGIALEYAAADLSIIPVLIVTPLVSPVLSASYTPGTVGASELVAVDASKDIAIFRNMSAVNVKAGASGTAGTVTVFPATASRGSFGLSATNQTGNTAVTINADAMGQATVVHVADPGAAASYIVQSTAALDLAEVDVLQGAVAGTQVASKAVIADANVNTGVSKVTSLYIGSTGAEVQVTSTPAELNLLDLTAQSETVLVAGAVSVVKRITTLSGASGAYAVTLDAPNATMLGQVKVIQYLTGSTNAITMALTNVIGGSAATTASFNAADETLVLVAGASKWIVVGEAGVTLS